MTNDDDAEPDSEPDQLDSRYQYESSDDEDEEGAPKATPAGRTSQVLPPAASASTMATATVPTAAAAGVPSPSTDRQSQPAPAESLASTGLPRAAAAAAPAASLVEPAAMAELMQVLNKEREMAAAVLGESSGTFVTTLNQAVNAAIAGASAFDLLKMTTQHEKGCSKQMDNFLACLEKHPELFGNLMQAPVKVGTSTVPKIVFIHKIPEGKSIINAVLTFYVTTNLIYLERTPTDGCPFRQMSTMNTYLKQIFSEGKNKYGWNWSLEKDFGSGIGFVKKLNSLADTIKKDHPVSFLRILNSMCAQCSMCVTYLNINIHIIFSPTVPFHLSLSISVYVDVGLW